MTGNNTSKSEFSKACIIRLPELKKSLGLSRSAIYDRMRLGSPRFDALFPRPFRLNSRADRGAVGWLQEDVDQYIAACRSVSGSSDMGGVQ